MTRDVVLRRLSVALFAFSLVLLIAALPAVNQLQNPSMGIALLGAVIDRTLQPACCTVWIGDSR